MAEMANKSQKFNKSQMTWQRVLFESDDFDVSGKNFQMHRFINIQIVDLYDLANEICPGGG